MVSKKPHRHLLAGLVCLVAVWSVAVPAVAQESAPPPAEEPPPEDAAEDSGGDDRAVQWYQLAMKAFKEKRWGEAALAFDAAYRYHADPTLLFNAARAYQRDDQLETAKARYEELLQASSGVDPDIRQRAVDAVVQVEVLIQTRQTERAREDERARAERESAANAKSTAEREALEARLAQLEIEAEEREARLRAEREAGGTTAPATRPTTASKPSVSAIEDDDEFQYDARRQPNAFAQRTFATPGSTFGGRGSLYAGHITGGTGAAGMGLTLGYGLTDEVEVGASVLPATFAPNATYGPPGVYAIVHANAGLEFGMLFGVNIPVGFNQIWSVPWYGLTTLPLGDMVRLDLGLGMVFLASNPVSVTLDVPIELSVSVTDEIFVNVFTSIVLPRFNEKYMTMPFGFGAGYTLTTSEGPMADVMLHLQWPRLYNNLASGNTEADTILLVLSGRFYFYL